MLVPVMEKLTILSQWGIQIRTQMAEFDLLFENVFQIFLFEPLVLVVSTHLSSVPVFCTHMQ